MKIISFLLLVVFPLILFASSTPIADKVVVIKSERKMELLYQGKVVRSYDISLGDNPVGHKQMQGDERTPEGDYVIDYRNPDSHYHLSLHISCSGSRRMPGLTIFSRFYTASSAGAEC